MCLILGASLNFGSDCRFDFVLDYLILTADKHEVCLDEIPNTVFGIVRDAFGDLSALRKLIVNDTICTRLPPVNCIIDALGCSQSILSALIRPENILDALICPERILDALICVYWGAGTGARR